MPKLLGEILHDVLAQQMSIEIIARIRRRSRLEQRLRAARPDFVFIGLRRDETDAVAQHLLRALPGAKIVAFSSDIQRVWVHQMRPDRTELHDFSREALIALLNGAN